MGGATAIDRWVGVAKTAGIDEWEGLRLNRGREGGAKTIQRGKWEGPIPYMGEWEGLRPHRVARGRG